MVLQKKFQISTPQIISALGPAVLKTATNGVCGSILDWDVGVMAQW